MADSLVNDLSRVNEVLQDGVVDGGQSSGAGTFLKLHGVVLCWLWEDTSLSKYHDLLAEFLLELGGDVGVDSLVVTELTERNEHNNGGLCKFSRKLTKSPTFPFPESISLAATMWSFVNSALSSASELV